MFNVDTIPAASSDVKQPTFGELSANPKHFMICRKALARRVGLLAAMMWQQIESLTDEDSTYCVSFSGRRWVRKTFAEWGEWCCVTEDQARYALKTLRDCGGIDTCTDPGNGLDKCLFYATNPLQQTPPPRSGNSPTSTGDGSHMLSKDSSEKESSKNKTPEQSPAPAAPAPKRKPKAITAQMEQLRPMAQTALGLLIANCSQQGVLPPKNLTEEQIIVQVDALHRLDGIEARDFLPTLRFALQDEFWHDKLDSPAAWREIGSGKTSKWYKVHKKWKADGSPSGIAAPTTPRVNPLNFTVDPRDIAALGGPK